MTAPEAEPPRKRPSRLLLPFWWTNLAVAVALLLSYVSTHVSPATFWPLALLGVAYPYLLIANIAFVVWWLLFRRRRMLPSLVAVLLGLPYLGEHVQPPWNAADPATDADPVMLMSWNVRIFDFYNWSNNRSTRDRMVEFLRGEAPDVLCIQEFMDTRDPDHYYMRPDSLKKVLGLKYHHDDYTQHARLDHHFGIVTFSRHPIVGRGSIQFPDDLNNLCIWSDLLIGTDTVRVYNAHLASLRFDKDDYRFVQSLESGKPTDPISVAGPRILGRMKNAFIRRATETETIVRHMRKSPHPVVWCGDLNDTPMSYSYQLLRRQGLADAFTGSGQGFGVTYIGSTPRFRIDHILHDAGIRTWDLRTIPVDFSDHRPISVRMALPRKDRDHSSSSRFTATVR